MQCNTQARGNVIQSGLTFVNGVVQKQNFDTLTTLPSPATPPSSHSDSQSDFSSYVICHAFNTPMYKIIAMCIEHTTALQDHTRITCDMKACLAIND